ncbi:ParB/RepB/Spo0J family partition protein [Sphingomonas sp. LY29]|uniref:ParB/RepB/Spo0J family partition protein n=1 Tax=Sphingomonas sp. LY29 TaxID=3095341 RepID=UPI002D7A04F8|nr:ParB/RepB/Spo0J family partition protein [Sphingomonas sp. LY29]WRP24919.1 ParB/RepB/Spo0J family partition protein [Sphingomonas sp. LY29]
MKKPGGLGRGLSALIDESFRPPATGQDHGAMVREIEIGRIRPNDTQPRKRFDDAAIEELSSSIKERGVLQPILIRTASDGYSIIAGERRWRAAQKAGLHTIPAIVRTFDDGVAAEVALIENIQREDLNAIEEAEGYRQLINNFNHTQDDLGKVVGKSRSHISNLLRLLDLPKPVRDMLVTGDLSMGHARAIASAPNAEEIARQIVAEGLSVRQAEALVRDAKPAKAKAKTETGDRRPVDADLAALERQLGDLLGLRVKVAHGKGGGNVVVHYSSLDQLDMICQRLSGEPI